MNQEELKQRLIEIIQTATVEMKYCTSEGIPIVTTEKQIVDDGEISPLAEHLIANGVTIRERGEWLPIFNDSRCSVCGYENNACTVTRVRDDSPFCPHCGADMRGVTKTEKGGAE